MSDAVDRGITVTEMAPMDNPIDVSRETTAAFVGRALRGPLNQPVLISGFGGFRRRFGDIWSRSSLGPAVQQFFEHGGKRVYVVRVSNYARGAMICLPASGSALVLRALEPGSTECFRAAVDYDAIDDDNDALFNLTLQRIDPVTAHVSDQEMYHRAHFEQGEENFIADLLLSSALARVEGPLPTHRPEKTAGRNAPPTSAYVYAVQAGTDGHELSDYDLVGSRRAETGLFALQEVERFDLLYLPPPGKSRDLGPMSILAADRYCREKNAMLIVDPHSNWVTVDTTASAVRNLGYASPNMLGYFPRMRHRYDKDSPPRTMGGAIAGLLCKLDRSRGVWHELDAQGMGLNRNYVPTVAIDAEAASTLARAGLNSISRGPAGSARLAGSVTMGWGSESHREFASLPVRRLCLRIIGAIEDATRWAVFEASGTRLAARIESQVTAYLSAHADMGAFEHDRFSVHCDVEQEVGVPAGAKGVTILIVFQPAGCKESTSVTLHQSVQGCRVASTAFAPVDLY